LEHVYNQLKQAEEKAIRMESELVTQQTARKQRETSQGYEIQQLTEEHTRIADAVAEEHAKAKILVITRAEEEAETALATRTRQHRAQLKGQAWAQLRACLLRQLSQHVCVCLDGWRQTVNREAYTARLRIEIQNRMGRLSAEHCKSMDGIRTQQHERVTALKEQHGQEKHALFGRVESLSSQIKTAQGATAELEAECETLRAAGESCSQQLDEKDIQAKRATQERDATINMLSVQHAKVLRSVTGERQTDLQLAAVKQMRDALWLMIRTSTMLCVHEWRHKWKMSQAAVESGAALDAQARRHADAVGQVQQQHAEERQSLVASHKAEKRRLLERHRRELQQTVDQQLLSLRTVARVAAMKAWRNAFRRSLLSTCMACLRCWLQNVPPCTPEETEARAYRCSLASPTCGGKEVDRATREARALHEASTLKAYLIEALEHSKELEADRVELRAELSECDVRYDAAVAAGLLSSRAVEIRGMRLQSLRECKNIWWHMRHETRQTSVSACLWVWYVKLIRTRQAHRPAAVMVKHVLSSIARGVMSTALRAMRRNATQALGREQVTLCGTEIRMASVWNGMRIRHAVAVYQQQVVELCQSETELRQENVHNMMFMQHTKDGELRIGAMRQWRAMLHCWRSLQTATLLHGWHDRVSSCHRMAHVAAASYARVALFQERKERALLQATLTIAVADMLGEQMRAGFVTMQQQHEAAKCEFEVSFVEKALVGMSTAAVRKLNGTARAINKLSRASERMQKLHDKPFNLYSPSALLRGSEEALEEFLDENTTSLLVDKGEAGRPRQGSNPFLTDWGPGIE